MRLRLFTFFTLLFCKSILISQTIANPSKNDFKGTLSFLASDWLEGRSAKQKGGLIASDYIASIMGLYQLIPYKKNTDSTFFQDFKIQEHRVKKAYFEIKKANKEAFLLSPETDFQVTPTGQSLQKEVQVVFAGYGLNLPKEGFDDYRNQNVKDKIVIVLKGFPSYKDTTTAIYQKLKKIFPEENDLEETKLQTAINKGASALIIIEEKAAFKSKDNKEAEVFHSLENASITSIPVFKLSRTAAEKLFAGTNISFDEIEKSTKRLNGTPALLKNTRINFSIEMQSTTFPVRNVLGMIRGKDTTKTIIIGAHYDHLGIKNDSIYNGADDNASGTSGMLALAKKWSESKIKPAYNLLFASWTAEELGLLGSEYFVQNFDLQKEKILLAINMDMISRSAPEDITHRILSIGTQKENTNLKEIANYSNTKLSRPFTLDLWETNGHNGSDYGSFTAKGIPVMTFFSGFHPDYHTPRDTASKVDLDKIKDVLFIVNTSILKFIENQQN